MDIFFEEITHVFVDFDGTLLNTIDCLYKAYCRFLAYYGIEGSKEEFNSLNGPSTFEIVEILKEKYKLHDNVQDLFQKYLETIKTNYIHAEAFQDSEFFLSFLHHQGKKIILVTSSREEMVSPIIKRLKWDKYFSDYTWGENVKNSKPSPDIYLEAWQKAKVSKSSAIAVEDSLNGVKSANSADMVVFGLSIDFSESELMKAGATKVFKNLTQIIVEFCCYGKEPQKKEYFTPSSLERLSDFFIYCDNLEAHPFVEKHKEKGTFSLDANFPQDGNDTANSNFDEYHLESLLTRIRQFVTKRELFFVNKLKRAVEEELGHSDKFEKFHNDLKKKIQRPFTKENIHVFGANGTNIIEGQTYTQLLEYRLYGGAIHSERRLSSGPESVQQGLVNAHIAVTKHLSLVLASTSMRVVQNIFSYRRMIFEVAKEKGKVELFPELNEFKKRVEDQEKTMTL
jgi:HAD superfamily hydrolase (TIGR01509 family)